MSGLDTDTEPEDVPGLEGKDGKEGTRPLGRINLKLGTQRDLETKKLRVRT